MKEVGCGAIEAVCTADSVWLPPFVLPHAFIGLKAWVR
jgi:hypothetical protein